MTKPMLNPSDVQRGDVVCHHRGVYRAVVSTVLKDKLGRTWVFFFVEQNCDETYSAYEDAFINQTGPQEILLNNFYNSNQLHVVSMSRFLKKFTSEEVPLLTPKLRKIAEKEATLLIVPEEVKSTVVSPSKISKNKPRKKPNE